MQIDRKAVNRMLNLNDEQLKNVIRSLADNAGLDLSGFQISPDDINSIRRALASATDEDIARAAEQLNTRKHKS